MDKKKCPKLKNFIFFFFFKKIIFLKFLTYTAFMVTNLFFFKNGGFFPYFFNVFEIFKIFLIYLNIIIYI